MAESTLNSSEVAALEAKLTALKKQIDETVARAHRRQKLMLVILVLLVLVVASYLSYVFIKVSEFTDAQTLVELVAAQVEPRLNAEADNLGEELKANAPRLIAHLETLVLDAPAQLAMEGEKIVARELDARMPKLENDLYEAITGILTETRAKAKEAGIDPNDEKQLNRLVGEIAPTLHSQAKVQIDKVYLDYSLQADGAIMYIDKLSEGVNLTKRQRLQRELLITGLALFKKIQLDPSRTPLQELLEDKTP